MAPERVKVAPRVSALALWLHRPHEGTVSRRQTDPERMAASQSTSPLHVHLDKVDLRVNVLPFCLRAKTMERYLCLGVLKVDTSPEHGKSVPFFAYLIQ
jgi:hypothetical protein